MFLHLYLSSLPYFSYVYLNNCSLNRVKAICGKIFGNKSIVYSIISVVVSLSAHFLVSTITQPFVIRSSPNLVFEWFVIKEEPI